MKKLFPFLALLIISLTAKAQPISDTVDVYFARAFGAMLIQSPAGGYTFGTGYEEVSGTVYKVSDRLSQHFSTVGNAQITEVLVWFGAAVVTNTPDVFTVGIHNVSADSMPAAAIGTATFSVADIQPSGATPLFTAIPFATPVDVSNDFAVVFDYAAVNDDTIGLVTSSEGSGYGEKRARLRLSSQLGGLWFRFTQLIPAGGDFDLMVVPVAQYTTGMSPVVTDQFSITLSPTTSTHFLTLEIDLQEQGEVMVNVFDLNGKSYYRTVQQFHAGSNALQIDVSDLPAGSYYINTSSNGSSVTGKFLVVN